MVLPRLEPRPRQLSRPRRHPCPHRVGGGTIRRFGLSMPRQPLFRMATYLRNSVYAWRLPHLPLSWKLAQGFYLPAQAALYWADSGWRPATLARLAAAGPGRVPRPSRPPEGPAQGLAGGRAMSAAPDLDVVIVNWNAGALLRDCLAGLAEAEGAERVVVTVVDNASQDGSLEGLPELPGPLRLIRNREKPRLRPRLQPGRGGGHRIGHPVPQPRRKGRARHPATGPHHAPRRRGLGIVGARLTESDGRTARSCARAPEPVAMLGRAFALDRLGLVPSHFLLDWDHGEDRNVDQVMGAFLMIRRDLFESLGASTSGSSSITRMSTSAPGCGRRASPCATSRARAPGISARAPPGGPRRGGCSTSCGAKSSMPASISGGAARWPSSSPPSSGRCPCA